MKNFLELSRFTPFFKKKKKKGLQMAVKSLKNAVGKVYFQYFQSAFIFVCLTHVLHRLTVIRTF